MRAALRRARLPQTLFKADIYAIIHCTVEQLGEDIGVLDAPGGNADVEMMTHFYIIAAAGVVES